MSGWGKPHDAEDDDVHHFLELPVDAVFPGSTTRAQSSARFVMRRGVWCGVFYTFTQIY